MNVFRTMAALALAAAALAAGCSKSETVVLPGNLDRSIQFIQVPSRIEVVTATVERNAAGDIASVQAQFRNTSNRRKAWELEYMVQFFAADGREVPSTAKGWKPVIIGRGELKSVGGATASPGAQLVKVSLRSWSAD